MRAIPRIRTKRSLAERIALTVYYSCTKSWYLPICFYALIAAALIVINYQG